MLIILYKKEDDTNISQLWYKKIQLWYKYDKYVTIMIQISHKKIQLWYKYDRYILNRFKSNIKNFTMNKTSFIYMYISYIISCQL